jgi:DNA polymerase-3 subunit delta'
MSFSDLKEQRTVAGQLQRSLKRGRLAHAYLFAGPRGSGKAAVARALAQALNCPEREHDACGRCDSCRRIAEAVHPDVYWVRPEMKSRQTSVERIREFEKAIYLKPTLAQVKVGVIVDADCLTESASNAFLKTLEEPPAQTVIVLLSAEPQRLLPTILSRCLKLNFGPAGAQAASPYRSRVLGSLQGFTARGAEKVAATYRLLAQLTALLAELREQTRARIEAEANLDQYAELDAKVREKLEKELEARIEGEYRALREQVLEEVYGWFSDVLLQVIAAGDSLLAHPDVAPATRQAAAGLSYEQASQNLEAVERIREALFRNVAEPLALEVGLLRVTQ